MNELPWWAWTMLATGVLATVAAFVALFLPDFHRPPLTCECKDAAGSEAFMDAVSRFLNVPILRGGSADILQNGCRFFPAILDAIRRARRSVNFQVYIFNTDRIGKQFVDAFEDRAKAGVDVRVMLDGFGSWRFGRDEEARLRKAGVKLQFFRPIRPHSLVRAFKRDHRRAIVVDGRVAFTGGAAVADKWDGDARSKEEWRDSMTRLTGALAHGVQTAFGENWVYRTGEILTGEPFFPPMPGDAPDTKNVPHEPCAIALVSSPADMAQPIRVLLWLSFTCAKKRLWISSSYFVPERRLRDAIAERARAGVDVRLLVPGPATDAKPVRMAGRSHYEELLEAGVRIFEYQPGMMHAKTVVADGLWTLVGSANMDRRSVKLNEENIIGISDPQFAADVETGILTDFECSKEIELETFRARGVGARALERISRLLIEQY
ncbi:MAG TPA: phospholipase D-like domain-containing protein [Gemmatimonadales bacterium]|nr:phospholipase D-like domain-containing protein [Gemmatimonadales bacterium]